MRLLSVSRFDRYTESLLATGPVGSHMGFGSYDESEQENQELTTGDDEAEGINVHESDHDGDVTFEAGVSTDDLISRLGEMRNTPTEE